MLPRQFSLRERKREREIHHQLPVGLGTSFNSYSSLTVSLNCASFFFSSLFLLSRFLCANTGARKSFTSCFASFTSNRPWMMCERPRDPRTANATNGIPRRRNSSCFLFVIVFFFLTSSSVQPKISLEKTRGGEKNNESKSHHLFSI